MKKVCILIEKLNGGGAERSAGLLSEILSNIGYDVTIIILYNDISYSYRGTLINLGLYKSGSRSFKNKFFRYVKLHEVLKNKRFDLILDFRMKFVSLRELLLNTLVFNTKIINMVRSYNLSWYLPNPKILSQYLYKNYTGVNAVSYKIQKEIEAVYKFSNVHTIYNPIDVESISKYANTGETIKEDFILAVGRIDKNKQFDKLITSYHNSVLKARNIKLYIIGKGEEKQCIDRCIATYQLEDDVRVFSFQKNPFSYMRQAKFLVLSSINEGFPRVVLESLACKTPVVSFDCNSGPSEIIFDRKNGLLVKNQDFNALTLAMNEMVENEVLYRTCKANSLYKLERFSMPSITMQWQNYIAGILS